MVTPTRGRLVLYDFDLIYFFQVNALDDWDTDDGDSSDVTAIVIIVLVTLPIVFFLIGMVYVKLRVRKLQEYESKCRPPISITAAVLHYLYG